MGETELLETENELFVLNKTKKKEKEKHKQTEKKRGNEIAENKEQNGERLFCNVQWSF